MQFSYLQPWSRPYLKSLLLATLLCVAIGRSLAAEPLNEAIRQTVEVLATTRSNGGYDINAAFSKDLKYGDRCCIKALAPPSTMCVAAVAEVIVETINRLSDSGAFQALPIETWSRGSITSLRANMFMFKGTGSRGTGHALAKLGVGREKKFAELRPYDFINFNRTNKTGHAAVFIAYLDQNGQRQNKYSQGAIGFAYFSAQGKGKPDAGFGERHAFFDGHCPPTAETKRDCGVVRSSNLALLNGGELWHPSDWKTEEAKAMISRSVRSTLTQRYPGATRAFIDTQLETELNRELAPNSDHFDGVTTD